MMSGWILDDEAILCPGWSGTMFEQCSPIIKITEEDYDNSGKKKVDVLAGWFGDIWNWGVNQFQLIIAGMILILRYFI